MRPSKSSASAIILTVNRIQAILSYQVFLLATSHIWKTVGVEKETKKWKEETIILANSHKDMMYISSTKGVRDAGGQN